MSKQISQALKLMQDATTTVMSNIPRSQVDESNGTINKFTLDYSRDGNSSVGIKKVRDTSQGNIVATNNAMDITTNGMIAVLDPSGVRGFVTGGSFREQADGTFKDSNNNVLLGWNYDVNNKLNPLQTLNSLEPVTTALIPMLPALSTSKVEVNGTTLIATGKSIKGAGQDIVLNRTGLNSATKDADIIIPENKNVSGSMILGTKLTFEVPPKLPASITYGGISMTKDITKTAIYSAISTTATFTSCDPLAHVPNAIPKGCGISVSIDGVPKIINFDDGASAANQFNSLDTLCKALRSIGLRARTVEGRLYVARAEGSTAAVTFTDSSVPGGAPSLVKTLGLQDIPSSALIPTFSSLKELNKWCTGKQDSNGFTSYIDETKPNTGKISITACNATQNMKFTVLADQPQSFKYATTGVCYTTDTDISARTSYTISAPNNGLAVGDWVYITDSGNLGVPDGNYLVTVALTDSFRVNMREDLAVANSVAVSTSNAVVLGPSPTWQKIAGQQMTPLPAAVTLLADNGGNVSITSVGHALANGDIVYISGLGGYTDGVGAKDVADGYYVVTRNTIDIITITPTEAGGVLGNHARTIGANGPAIYAGTQILKVVPAANVVANELLPNVMTTGVAGVTTIGLTLKNGGGYSKGDYIGFSGLPTPCVINGIPLTNGSRYLVTDVTGDIVTFESGTGAAGPAATATYGAGAGNVGPGFRVDNYGQFCKYNKLNQNKIDFKNTYTPGGLLDNDNTKMFDKEDIRTLQVDIYDSLGALHQLLIYVAKINDNTWAVEVAGVANANGTFDYITSDRNGMIVSGDLQFDGSGALVGVSGGIKQPISVQFDNGSNMTTTLFNWDGIKQMGDNFIKGRLTGDGHGVAMLQDTKINEDGQVVAMFDGGREKAIYMLPAVFADLNDMDNRGGIMIPSVGTIMQYLNWGKDGMKMSPKAIRSSNVSNTDQLLLLQEYSLQVSAEAQAMQAGNKQEETIINQLGR